MRRESSQRDLQIFDGTEKKQGGCDEDVLGSLGSTEYRIRYTGYRWAET